MRKYELMGVLMQLNMIEDTGKYDDLPYEKLEEYIEEGTLFTKFFVEARGFNPLSKISADAEEKLFDFLRFHLGNTLPGGESPVEKRALCVLTERLYFLLHDQLDAQAAVEFP